MADDRLGLTLGPLLYLWDEDRWRDFYFRIADEAEVETVVIGELVCSKRDHFHVGSLGEVAQRLTSAGKTVRLATLALVTLERELKAVRRLAAQDDFEVEVGELAAHAAMRGRPHAVGPMVNVYNASTARVLAQRGATSFCLPPELPASSIRAIVAGAPELAFEVFAFGKVPLAISARCAHARLKGLVKDNCGFICGEDPDGLQVDTLDHQPFLAINGVQTMSSACQSLLTDIPLLRSTGVRSLRLSPQLCDMAGVARVFRDVCDGTLEPAEGAVQLRALYTGATFSNGFLHGDAGHRFVADGVDGVDPPGWSEGGKGTTNLSASHTAPGT
jgi:collagenase-like PrtC family protease